MKVTKTTIEDSETSATIDLFDGLELPDEVKQEVIDEVGQYLVEQTLINVNQERSPISGGSWKRGLSPEYKKKKAREVGNTDSNIEFSGQTLDAFDYAATKDGLVIGVFGPRAPVADGHNNLSGKSSLPLRQFIPDVGQSYKNEIKVEVDRIIADKTVEALDPTVETFEGVETKQDLYVTLATIFGPLTRKELRLAAYRNPRVIDLLIDLELDDLL